ncbi:F-box/FBD/LRR-repeat protein [Senna tora]|uniref:F-box/FBD/LRR-repeat protein n=1 Tax=Senna tora TaxID=362788 RepID=A0A834TW50_9FABA|nr:F-box/FBD/LRR-repeat protein [Senna tora]
MEKKRLAKMERELIDGRRKTEAAGTENAFSRVKLPLTMSFYDTFNPWKSLWPSTSTLDFDDQNYKNNETQYSRFVQFVYTILVLRDSQPIKSFRLECKSTFTSNVNVNIWINSALQREVEHLEIGSLPVNIKLPSGILTCKTLVVLKLKDVNLNPVSSARLPSLKILHLKVVKFSTSLCFGKLLSDCTLLEDLFARCVQTKKGPLFKLPKLISANVEIFFESVIMKALSNAKFLRYREQQPHEEEKEGELVVSKIFFQTQPRQCNWASDRTTTPPSSEPPPSARRRDSTGSGR